MEVAASGFVKELEEMENELEELPEGTTEEHEQPVSEILATEKDEQQATESVATEELVSGNDLSPQADVEERRQTTEETWQSTEINPQSEEAPVLLDGDDMLPELMEDWSGISKPARARGGAGSATSMSTIHPDIIKQRVKKAINRKENAQALQRIRAKGEANAVTRKKRENKDLIRADGIWGWDN